MTNSSTNGDTSKREFLISYDYGMGGVWVIFRAGSAEEIVRIYPVLQVVDHRPDWMSDEVYDRIAASSSFDIDSPPAEQFLALMKGV